MSSFLLSGKEGGITVEASIAVPFFLFAVINLLSVILVFGEYSSNLGDMHRKTKELALHAHITKGNELLEEDEMIVMSKTQEMEPMIPVLGFDTSRILIISQARKWTGYNVMDLSMEQEEEEWVYITPSGEAYHKNPNCSYLNPKIYSAVSSQISGYRNLSGEIYRQCETCKDITLTGICFYTEYGNRYHATLKCSSLKRTIHAIRLSEVGNRHFCKKCVLQGE